MKKTILIPFILLIVTPFFGQSLSDSLVAHYLLDGNGIDNVGNNDGVLMGPMSVLDRNGNLNSAYQFDGINDWINIGNTPELNITGDITVSAWVKTPTSWPVTYHDPMIYARYSASGYDGVNLWLDNPHLTSRSFGFIVKTGSNTWGNDFAVGTSSLQLDTWYFIVGIREGNSLKIYINGVLEGSDFCSTNPINYGINPKATIGEKAGAVATWCDGVIDDVKIYKRALSDSEIQILATSIESDEVEKVISIYPNPTSDYLKVNIEKSVKNNEVRVINVNGQIIRKKSFNKNEIEIDVKGLKGGIYFVQVFSDSEILKTSKFLKK